MALRSGNCKRFCPETEGVRLDCGALKRLQGSPRVQPAHQSNFCWQQWLWRFHVSVSQLAKTIIDIQNQVRTSSDLNFQPNFGISGNQHQFRRAALDNAIKGGEQDLEIARGPSVQLLNPRPRTKDGNEEGDDNENVNESETLNRYLRWGDCPHAQESGFLQLQMAIPSV
jgi:hypothetical protein